jgi:hypothetical protein
VFFRKEKRFGGLDEREIFDDRRRGASEVLTVVAVEMLSEQEQGLLSRRHGPGRPPQALRFARWAVQLDQALGRDSGGHLADVHAGLLDHTPKVVALPW